MRYFIKHINPDGLTYTLAQNCRFYAATNDPMTFYSRESAINFVGKATYPPLEKLNYLFNDKNQQIKRIN